MTYMIEEIKSSFLLPDLWAKIMDGNKAIVRAISLKKSTFKVGVKYHELKMGKLHMIS